MMSNNIIEREVLFLILGLCWSFQALGTCSRYESRVSEFAYLFLPDFSTFLHAARHTYSFYSQDLKDAARNECTPALRLAAGLDAPPAPTAAPPTNNGVDNNGGSLGPEPTHSSAEEPAPRPTDTMPSGDGDSSTTRADGEANNAAGSSGNNIDHGEDPPPVEGDASSVDAGNRTGENSPAPTSATAAVGDGLAASGGTNAFSSLAARVLGPKSQGGGGGKPRVGKAAMALSSAAGRGRREEARRRAELYEVCRRSISFLGPSGRDSSTPKSFPAAGSLG